MFFAALRAITKRFKKQPKCPLTDDWIKLRYTYTIEYYSTTRKNEIMPFAATGMDLEITVLNGVSQRKISGDITICGI